MDATQDSSINHKKSSIILFHLALLFFAFLWVWTQGGYSPSFQYSVFGDDNTIFSLVGRSLVEGKELYTETWDHKGPVLLYTYALAALISAKTSIGIAFIQSLFYYIILLYSYKISRLYISKTASFIVVALLPILLGECIPNVSSHLLCLQIFSCYLILYKNEKKLDKPILLPLVLCCSMAFYSKFTICAFWAPFLLFESYCIWKKHRLHRLVKELTIATSAFTVLSLVIFTFVDFKAFWCAYIEFNFAYGTAQKSIILTDPISVFRGFLSLCYPYIKLATLSPKLSLLALVNLLFIITPFVLWPHFKRNKLIFTAFLTSFILLFIATFMGSYAIPYYYISFQPFYVLSIIFLLRFLYNKRRKYNINIKYKKLLLLIFLIMVTAVHIKIAMAIYQIKQRTVKQVELRKYTLSQYISDSDTILAIGYNYLISDVNHIINRSPIISHFYHPFTGFSSNYTKFQKINEHVLECKELIKNQSVDHIISGYYYFRNQHFEKLLENNNYIIRNTLHDKSKLTIYSLQSKRK